MAALGKAGSTDGERTLDAPGLSAVDRIEPPRDAVKWLGTSLAEFVEENERVSWLGRLILMVGLDARNLNPKVGNLTRQARQPNHYLMARIIRHGQETGVFRSDIDADQTGILPAAIRTGLVACWQIDPEIFDIRRTTEAFVRTLLPALLSQGSGRRKIAMPKMKPDQMDAAVAQMLVNYGLSLKDVPSTAPRGSADGLVVLRSRKTTVRRPGRARRPR